MNERSDGEQSGSIPGTRLTQAQNIDFVDDGPSMHGGSTRLVVADYFVGVGRKENAPTAVPSRYSRTPVVPSASVNARTPGALRYKYPASQSKPQRAVCGGTYVVGCVRRANDPVNPRLPAACYIHVLVV